MGDKPGENKPGEKIGDKKSRRNANFTFGEQKLLLALIKGKKNIIDCKKSHADMWKKKKDAWEEIAIDFNANSYHQRDASTLRIKYENMKKIWKMNMKKSTAESGVDVTPGYSNHVAIDQVPLMVTVSPGDFEIIPEDGEEMVASENSDWSYYTPHTRKRQPSFELMPTEASGENPLSDSSDDESSIKPPIIIKATPSTSFSEAAQPRSNYNSRTTIAEIVNPQVITLREDTEISSWQFQQSKPELLNLDAHKNSLEDQPKRILRKRKIKRVVDDTQSEMCETEDVNSVKTTQKHRQLVDLQKKCLKEEHDLKIAQMKIQHDLKTELLKLEIECLKRKYKF